MGKPKNRAGGWAVTLAVCNAHSWRFLIGTELWRKMDSPTRVSLRRRGNVLHIAPTSDDGAGTYAVTGDGEGTPRLTISAKACSEELRMAPPTRYEHCQVRHRELIVFIV